MRPSRGWIAPLDTARSETQGTRGHPLARSLRPPSRCWYLRSDMIWCLSGGVKVYARTQKGDMPTTIKDMARLDPLTVKLWNGEKWTQVLGLSRAATRSEPLEIELRNGERIGCTEGHFWPTRRGNVRADQLCIGDVICTCTLPEPYPPVAPKLIPEEIGWFIGLYLGEGSRSAGCIQIAGHIKEEERFSRLQVIGSIYGGTCRLHPTGGNAATINLHGRLLHGLIDTYIAGTGASRKHLTNACWQRNNAFLDSLLEGYLSGDGHWDVPNNRWRLGFTANYELADDLRTLCARVGFPIRLKQATAKLHGRAFPIFRGEIRYERSRHHNAKDGGEVVAIGRRRPDSLPSRPRWCNPAPCRRRIQAPTPCWR